MTFEDAYGQWLVSEINDRTVKVYGLTCRQYNELSYKPLSKNPNEIALVISGGGAARSTVRGQDQNSGTFSVIVLCQKKYLEQVQAAISYVQKQYNAVPLELEYYGDRDFNANDKPLFASVKSVFFTPIVLDAQDYPTDEFGTLKAVFLQFTVTVLYGTTAVVSPAVYTLSIDGVNYAVNHVATYDNASIPAYDSFLAQGEERNTQIAISKNNSYAITIYKTSAKDDLQAILENEAYGQENGLWGRELALVFTLDDKEVILPIQTYQLTESYVNNAAAFVLTLMA
jgi:hypothetical protein